MSFDPRRHGWPAERLGEALEALARASGLAPRAAELAGPPPGTAGERLGEWIEEATEWLGLEAEAVEAPYAEVGELLERSAPAILRLGAGDGGRFLAVRGAGRRRMTILDPELRTRRVRLRTLAASLRRGLEAGRADQVDGVLAGAGIRGRRRRRARRALLAELLAPYPVSGCWLLRLPPEAGFWRQLRGSRLGRLALAGFGAHALQQILLIVSWWVLGRGVLAGRLDLNLVLIWALLLLTTTPLRTMEQWALARLTAGAGALLKRRLLAGALRLEPEEIRHQGVGQFLGRVIDSEAVETLVLSGGHVGLIAIIELVLALPILAAGAAGWLHALLLAAWLALTFALWGRFLVTRGAWTGTRLEITHELVEKMVGHRTRLAQQRPSQWHEEEDQTVERYLDRSRAMDRLSVALKSLVPRGWLLVGILGLAPAFVAGTASVGRLAVGVGGVLFAYRAFWKLVRGLADLGEAMIAWRNVAPLFHAASRPRFLVPPGLAPRPQEAEAGTGRKLIEAREVSFRYPGRADPVLQNLELEVRAGDRVLLEGPSGSGKSTLASLLVGLRSPDSGLLLLEGLDRKSLGDRGWRRRVAAAPQFHENHVFTETFAFNLLMGRDWPPPPEDLTEAEEVCRALGLGELLERMPSGLLQTVGESGWQLSHGEKSRLFIARAILQKSDLVVFDESFAALDPENLRRSLAYVMERAPTLLVVAHP